MAQSNIYSDFSVVGQLTCKTFNPPAACITDPAVAVPSSPPNAIATTKVRHRYEKPYAQPNTTATTETKPIHVIRGTNGTINSIVAGSIAVNIGAATVTVDLKKNGTSVLSSVITLNSANTARVAVSGTLSVAPTTCVAGDWLEVVITATAGGGTLATGVYVQVQIDEDPS